MPDSSPALWAVPALLFLVLARWISELILTRLNEQHVEAHAGTVPEPFRDLMPPATYAKAVDYTMARSRFGQIETTFDAMILSALLLFGGLPWAYDLVVATLGNSAWLQAAAIFLILTALSLVSLPFAWAAQFRLEARFGFNTTTPRTWWSDRFKGLLLGALLGYPLLVLILKTVDWAGSLWWLWAWSALLLFQLGTMLLAPILILPLFNRFTPLPEGSLRQRLHSLSERTAFPHRNILVMDGSRRSRHSNAFFTGFGQFRRIVLFDTLIAQLDDAELEAVLAHEIAHYKLGHIPRRLLVSTLGSLVLFWILGQLAAQSTVNLAFGFAQPGVGPLLLLALVFGGLFSFWLSPLFNAWSRRHEYQADRFAAAAIGQSRPLIHSLRKLSRDNLSNLTPHPLYSRFHYSHPTLLEREQALQQSSVGPVPAT
jgi:STE24 endopeptidase